jgi:hypothetical protein
MAVGRWYGTVQAPASHTPRSASTAPARPTPDLLSAAGNAATTAVLRAAAGTDVTVARQAAAAQPAPAPAADAARDPDNPNNTLTPDEMYRYWLTYWLPRCSKAVADEAALRRQIVDQDPAAFAHNKWRFDQGLHRALGPDYEKVYGALAFHQAIVRDLAGVKNWLVSRETLHEKVTFMQVNQHALDLAKGWAIFDTWVAPIAYGLLGGGAMAGGPPIAAAEATAEVAASESTAAPGAARTPPVEVPPGVPRQFPRPGLVTEPIVEPAPDVATPPPTPAPRPNPTATTPAPTPAAEPLTGEPSPASPGGSGPIELTPPPPKHTPILTHSVPRPPARVGPAPQAPKAGKPSRPRPVADDAPGPSDPCAPQRGQQPATMKVKTASGKPGAEHDLPAEPDGRATHVAQDAIDLARPGFERGDTLLIEASARPCLSCQMAMLRISKGGRTVEYRYPGGSYKAHNGKKI